MLLLITLGTVSSAGWRVASALTGSGLLRVLGASALAAGAAVLSALGLGLVDLGASPLALSAVALLLWAAVRHNLPSAHPGARAQLTGWWSGLSPAARAARAALAGATVAYAAWLLGHPLIGLDALTDHLALPVDWVHNGRPGSLVPVNVSLPYANYPNTHEVLVTWVTAIARTLVPALLLTPASLLLLAASVRAGLAQLGVRAHLAWMATGAMATLPIAVVQLTGPNTDVPAVAWLACSAALAAGAARGGSPGLLALALLAAGLAVGTKTTPAPLAVLVLLIALWRLRRELRHRWHVPALGLLGAVGVGGVWYVRNLFEHGSPLWPLSTTPWGDPIPPVFRSIDASLLDNLSATLRGRVGLYELVLAGGLVLLGGALSAVVWDRRRITSWGAVIVLAALLAWANAPYTGISASTQLSLGATRYLLPCLLAAAVTVALARRSSPLAALVLLGALAFNLDRDWIIGFPAAPSPGLLIAGALAAAALSVLIQPTVRAAIALEMKLAVAAGLITAAMLAALLVPVGGYLSAHADAGLFDAGVARWLNGRAAFRSGHAPVSVGPVQVAVLTGPRLTHPVILLARDERCGRILTRARSSWLVLQLGPSAQFFTRHWLPCLQTMRPAYLDPNFVVYAPPALRVPAT